MKASHSPRAACVTRALSPVSSLDASRAKRLSHATTAAADERREGRCLLLLCAASAKAAEPAVQPSTVARRAQGRRHEHAQSGKAAANLGLDDLAALVQQPAMNWEPSK
eukprot:scaffold58190_cov64-Phaeocystis_antarctica.AAC.4